MLTLDQRDEVARTLEIIRSELEGLVVRGVTASGPEHAAALGALRDELGRRDAPHLASRLGELADALARGERGGAALLLRASTTLRVFERVMTLDVAEGLLSELADGEEGELPAPGTRPAGLTLPPAAERQQLRRALSELARAALDLVASGLTAASPATRRKIDVSAAEAARLKLGRLAPALRYVDEEVKRFVEESAAFSPQRLLFFLTRSWLILRGLERALEREDPAAWADLVGLRGGAPVMVPLVRAVALGVSKRVVQGVTSAFDFRLRVLEPAGPLAAGQPLSWSFLRQLERAFSADALLHIEQPQGFRPKALLGGEVVSFTKVAVSLAEQGPARLQLGPPSKVAVGPAHRDWEAFASWDPRRALERVRAHRPSPLDLEVELEEEVVLDEWTLEAGRPGFKPDTLVYPVTWRGVTFEAIASAHAEGEALRGRLDALVRQETRPPLLGLLHYELGRLVLRPLSLLEASGPQHLMISNENVNLAELTRAIMKRV